MVVWAMSTDAPEQPDTGFDFDPDSVVESPEEIVKPQPIDSETVTPAEMPRQSAADRLRSRLRNDRGGATPSEPSTRRGRATPPKPAPPKPREGSLVKPLTELYTTVGLMLAPIDPVCSVAFIENAETCAKSLETLARENETVRRVILAMTQTSAWGGVIIAHLPLMLMITMHHGPREIQDRVSPLAMMMNPSAMQKAAEAQAAREAAGEGEA